MAAGPERADEYVTSFAISGLRASPVGALAIALKPGRVGLAQREPKRDTGCPLPPFCPHDSSRRSPFPRPPGATRPAPSLPYRSAEPLKLAAHEACELTFNAVRYFRGH